MNKSILINNNIIYVEHPFTHIYLVDNWIIRTGGSRLHIETIDGKIIRDFQNIGILHESYNNHGFNFISFEKKMYQYKFESNQLIRFKFSKYIELTELEHTIISFHITNDNHYAIICGEAGVRVYSIENNILYYYDSWDVLYNSSAVFDYDTWQIVLLTNNSNYYNTENNEIIIYNFHPRNRTLQFAHHIYTKIKCIHVTKLYYIIECEDRYVFFTKNTQQRCYLIMKNEIQAIVQDRIIMNNNDCLFLHFSEQTIMSNKAILNKYCSRQR